MYYIEKNTENIAAKRCGHPVPGNIPGQVEQDSEQPDVAQDVPDHCRGLELDLPTQIIV